LHQVPHAARSRRADQLHNMRAQLQRVRIYDLEFLFDTDGEAVSHRGPPGCVVLSGDFGSPYHTPPPQNSHLPPTHCSRKMRMSGLSKVEMSAFMGWGAHGDGAYRLEPARTGSTEGVARGKAEAFDASGGRRAFEGNRPSGPAAAFGA